MKDQFVINEPNFKNGVKINDIDPYDMGLKSQGTFHTYLDEGTIGKSESDRK